MTTSIVRPRSMNLVDALDAMFQARDSAEVARNQAGPSTMKRCRTALSGLPRWLPMKPAPAVTREWVSRNAVS